MFDIQLTSDLGLNRLVHTLASCITKAKLPLNVSDKPSEPRPRRACLLDADRIQPCILDYKRAYFARTNPSAGEPFVEGRN